jgi:hypothetical protein
MIQEKCCICLETYEFTEKHEYCVSCTIFICNECLCNWFKDNQICPICKDSDLDEYNSDIYTYIYTGTSEIDEASVLVETAMDNDLRWEELNADQLAELLGLREDDWDNDETDTNILDTDIDTDIDIDIESQRTIHMMDGISNIDDEINHNIKYIIKLILSIYFIGFLFINLNIIYNENHNNYWDEFKNQFLNMSITLAILFIGSLFVLIVTISCSLLLFCETRSQNRVIMRRLNV